MIEVAVHNKEGKQVESLKVEESVFGSNVRYPLLKQAIVMYHANKRQGTVKTKGRSEVAGSTHKLYRQKGTGNARVGNRRTGIRTGGGMIFAKVPRDFSKDMPKKQRRLARDSAILSKLQDGNVVIIDELKFDAPKTKDFAKVLGNLKIDRSCLVSIEDYDRNLYRSARNVPRISVMPVRELNAGDICNKQKILFSKEAFMSLVNSQNKED